MFKRSNVEWVARVGQDGAGFLRVLIVYTSPRLFSGTPRNLAACVNNFPEPKCISLIYQNHTTSEFTVLDLNPTKHHWDMARLASWMFSRQFCSSCVTPSCQCGPKSPNVSRTFLNLSHEELRRLRGQKAVRHIAGKKSLIKWPVSVYLFVYIRPWC